MSEWRIPASQLPIPKETLRATFAGMAMQSILANDARDKGKFVYDRSWNNSEAPRQLAKLAVEAADALIEELSK